MELTVQGSIADMTEEALEDLIASVRRMPVDKLTWRPLDAGRTALDQFQECATAPNVYRSRLLGTEYLTERETRKSWDVDETERRARISTAELVKVIRATPPERFAETVTVPWGTATVLETMRMHLWNLTYHLGAVNYIQTLDGDLD